MFAGNTMLLPKSMTANPEAFNKGQLNGPGPSAGPFIVSNLDRTAQRIVLTRNPKWWGTPPLLDSITYLVLDDAARIPALQNNTIDASGLGLARRADHRPRARPGSRSGARPSNSWYHFTFNGAPGSILADKALRLAIAKGIDRQAIADITQRGLADKPGHPEQPRLRRRARRAIRTTAASSPLTPRRPSRNSTRSAGAERAVPREGRPPAGDPRRDVRLAEHPADRPDRAEQPGPDRGQARAE